jgi:hypothetical protein
LHCWCWYKNEENTSVHPYLLMQNFLTVQRGWQEVLDCLGDLNVTNEKQLIASWLCLAWCQPKTFNIGCRIFHLDAWWKLPVHLIWADECPHVTHTVVQGWAKILSPNPAQMYRLFPMDRANKQVTFLIGCPPRPPHFGPYQCLPHATYTVNDCPIAGHKHEKVDSIMREAI